MESLRKVVIAFGQTPVNRPLGHVVQLPHQNLRILRHQPLFADGDDHAVPLHRDRFARDEKQVGGIFIYRLFEICLNTFHDVLLPHILIIVAYVPSQRFR